MNVGLNIKAIRQEKGISQSDLANAVGVTSSMLCQIERGTKACSMQLGAEIAEALGCGINDLLGESHSA